MLKLTLTAACMAALMLTPAAAKELKLADFQPPTHFVVPEAYDAFAKTIAEGTGNAVTVTVYMGGELGAGPAEQYTRAVENVTDIAFGLPGYTASTFPVTLLSELPGVIDPQTGTEKIMASTDLLAAEYRRVVLLGLWNNAPNLLMTGSKPVRSLADVQGLKLRVPSRNAGLVVTAWGGTPVSMPASEIYNAMQTGVIDGAMIDATALAAFRLNEVTNHITTGMDTTISNFFLIMNRDSFEDLSGDQQQVVQDAGRQLALDANAAWLARSEAGLAEFGKTAGKEVITLTPDAAAAFDAASAPVVAQVVAEVDGQGLNGSAYVAALRGE